MSGDTLCHRLPVSSLFDLGEPGTTLAGYHPAHKLRVRHISSLLPTAASTRSNGASRGWYQHDTRPLWHHKVHLGEAFTPPRPQTHRQLKLPFRPKFVSIKSVALSVSIDLFTYSSVMQP